MRTHRNGGVVGFVRGMLHRYEQRHAAQTLLRLDDHLLCDIGLTREQARQAAHGRFSRKG